MKRNSITLFNTLRAIRGAWHLAPIAAIFHRPILYSAFLVAIVQLEHHAFVRLVGLLMLNYESDDEKIAPIEVGYLVATKSGTSDEQSDAVALQKKSLQWFVKTQTMGRVVCEDTNHGS